jgi:hypothetical protein
MLCGGTHLVGDVQGQSSWGTEDAAATTADKDGLLPADMAAHMGTGQLRAHSCHALRWDTFC